MASLCRNFIAAAAKHTEGMDKVEEVGRCLPTRAADDAQKRGENELQLRVVTNLLRRHGRFTQSSSHEYIHVLHPCSIDLCRIECIETETKEDVDVNI